MDVPPSKLMKTTLIFTKLTKWTRTFLEPSAIGFENEALLPENGLGHMPDLISGSFFENLHRGCSTPERASSRPLLPPVLREQPGW